MKDFRRYGAGALLLASLVSISAAGAPIILDAVDSGAYFDNGTHNPGIENYLTGEVHQPRKTASTPKQTGPVRQ